MNHPGGLAARARLLAVAAISIGIVMSVMDGAIANIALPRIARDFGVASGAVVWVVNGFQLALTVSLLPFAALGASHGAKRIFTWGLLSFTAASLLCGAATSLPLLVAARVAQGVGAAGMMSVYPALLTAIYPRTLLGRGIGISATVIAFSSALGPSVASAILSVASWPWLFMVNVPIGLAGFALCSTVLPRSAAVWRPFDWRGALGSGAVLALLVIGLDGLGRRASRGMSAVELAAAVVFGAVLLRAQARRSAPIVPIDLLRIGVFRLALGTSVCSYAAHILCFLSLPFLLQDSMGWSAVRTGLLLTPIPLSVALSAPLAGWLADRRSAGALCGIGLMLMALGALALRAVSPAATAIDIACRGAIFGLGFGFFQTPNNRALLHAAPPARAPGAGGLLATARTTGQSCGAALVAVSLEMEGPRGVHLALALSAGIAIVGALVSLLRLMPDDVHS